MFFSENGDLNSFWCSLEIGLAERVFEVLLENQRLLQLLINLKTYVVKVFHSSDWVQHKFI
jgi:hypothetical protein